MIFPGMTIVKILFVDIVPALAIWASSLFFVAFLRSWRTSASTCRTPARPRCAATRVGTDRGFLLRDMPTLEDYLHYRIVDVSSIKELARRWYPRAYFNSPEKNGNHRALADIRESHRGAALLPRGGLRAAARPDSDTAKTIAAKHACLPAQPSDPCRHREAGREHPSDPVHFFSAGRGNAAPVMVGVAQLVEHLVVVQDVAGSSPVTHPIGSPRVRTPVPALGSP